MKTVLLSLKLSLLLLVLAPSPVHGQNKQDVTKIVMPFYVIDGRLLVVKVKVNGVEVSMLWDTGSSGTVVEDPEAPFPPPRGVSHGIEVHGQYTPVIIALGNLQLKIPVLRSNLHDFKQRFPKGNVGAKGLLELAPARCREK